MTKNVLALDYGLKSVGVAVTVCGLSQPLTTFANDPDLLSKLLSLVREHKIDLVVLGGSEGEMLEKTKKFGRELSQSLGKPVEIIDETLSSKEASSRVAWLGGKKRRRQPLHHVAAAIILERYLDVT